MNIHEYQAKELLAKFGVACRRAGRLHRRSGQGRRRTGGPVWVVKVPDPRRSGAGQGRRCQGRSKVARRRARAERDAGHDVWSPSRPARGQGGRAGSMSKTAATSPGSFIFAVWSIGRPAGSPSSPRPKAAWTSRKWPRPRPRRSSPSRSIRSTACQRFHARKIAFGSGLKGKQVSRPSSLLASLQGVRRTRRLDARDQPAGRDRRRRVSRSTPR